LTCGRIIDEKAGFGGSALISDEGLVLLRTSTVVVEEPFDFDALVAVCVSFFHNDIMDMSHATALTMTYGKQLVHGSPIRCGHQWQDWVLLLNAIPKATKSYKSVILKMVKKAYDLME
jgi:hypothetical protein